jgi:hypothetical protein
MPPVPFGPLIDKPGYKLTVGTLKPGIEGFPYFLKAGGQIFDVFVDDGFSPPFITVTTYYPHQLSDQDNEVEINGVEGIDGLSGTFFFDSIDDDYSFTFQDFDNATSGTDYQYNTGWVIQPNNAIRESYVVESTRVWDEDTSMSLMDLDRVPLIYTGPSFQRSIYLQPASVVQRLDPSDGANGLFSSSIIDPESVLYQAYDLDKFRAPFTPLWYPRSLIVGVATRVDNNLGPRAAIESLFADESFRESKLWPKKVCSFLSTHYQFTPMNFLPMEVDNMIYLERDSDEPGYKPAVHLPRQVTGGDLLIIQDMIMYRGENDLEGFNETRPFYVELYQKYIEFARNGLKEFSERFNRFRWVLFHRGDISPINMDNLYFDLIDELAGNGVDCRRVAVTKDEYLTNPRDFISSEIDSFFNTES